MAKKTQSPEKPPAPRPVRSAITPETGPATKPATATKPAINLAVLAGFVFLILVLAFIIMSYYGAGMPITGEESSAPSLCFHGDRKPCTAGACEGTAICINGVWAGCTWEKTCVPGSRLPCTNALCLYAVKECNSCGTGYGPCLPPE